MIENGDRYTHAKFFKLFFKVRRSRDTQKFNLSFNLLDLFIYPHIILIRHLSKRFFSTKIPYMYRELEVLVTYIIFIQVSLKSSLFQNYTPPLNFLYKDCFKNSNKLLY